jgi:ferritin-like metal-binding protein YciE
MLFLPELTARREQLNEETKKHVEMLESQVRDLGDQLKKMNPSKEPSATPSPTAK